MSDITLQLLTETDQTLPSGPGNLQGISALDLMVQARPGDEERRQALVQQIDFCDQVGLMRYGESTQKQLKRLANEMLRSAFRSDLGTAGDLLMQMSDRMQELIAHDAESGTLSWWRSKANPEKRQRQYLETSQQLDQKQRELEGWRVRLLVELDLLEQTSRQVVQLYKELLDEIAVGEQKLAKVRAEELVLLQQQAQRVTASSEILLAQDLQNRCDVFEKRLNDLKVTQNACLQMAIQAQLLQHVNQSLVLKIQESLGNAMVLWRQSLATLLTAQYGRELRSSQNQHLLTVITEALDLQREGCQLQEKLSASLTTDTLEL